MKIVHRLKAVFRPETCLHCGCGDSEVYSEEYLDGRNILTERNWRCVRCKKHLKGECYGAADDIFWYLTTRWKRFDYLFLYEIRDKLGRFISKKEKIK